MEYEYTEEELIESIRKGNTDEAIYLISKGIKLDISSWNYNELHFAARYDDVKLMDFLLEMRFDIDIKDAKNNTPLHIAIKHHNIDAFLFLIEHGADISAKGEYEMTPLHYAAKINDIGMVRYLISKGADVKSCSVHNYLMIHFAIIGMDNVNDNTNDNNIDIKILIVDEFLKKIGTADIDNNIGHSGHFSYLGTFLSLICSRGYVKIIDFLMKRGMIIKTKILELSIREAVRNNHINIIKYFIDGVINVNDIIRGNNIIHYAADNDKLEILDYLIYRGADVNMADVDGNTPIYYTKTLDCTKMLVHNGAKINIINNGGTTPLVSAIWRKFDDIIIYLIGKGADINIGVNDDYSLYASVWHKSYNITKLLLEKGANPNRYTIGNFAPVWTAVRKGDIDTIKLLLRYGAKINMIVSSEGNNMLMKFILHRSFDSPIHFYIIKLLIKKGIDVWKVNNEGTTVFDIIRIREITYLRPILKNYPKVIPLVGMCIRIVQEHNIDTIWLPKILFKFPILL